MTTTKKEDPNDSGPAEQWQEQNRELVAAMAEMVVALSKRPDFGLLMAAVQKDIARVIAKEIVEQAGARKH